MYCALSRSFALVGLFIAVSLTPGCLLFATSDGGTNAPDAGEPEALEPDDAGQPDAGLSPTDGGALDADGGPDAGGEPDDAGLLDGGQVDAGRTDAGHEDAGLPDAGLTDDAGVDAGELPVTITANVYAADDPLLVGESFSFLLEGTNLDQINELQAPGVLIELDTATAAGTSRSGTLSIIEIDALPVDETVFEAEVAVTATSDNASSVATGFLFTVHRAYGPFVDRQALPVTPCGHPRRPCATIAAAAAAYSVIQQNAVSSAWLTTPFLRLTNATHNIPNTLNLDSIGLRGGYVFNDGEWIPPEGERQSTVALGNGASLAHTGSDVALSQALERIHLVGARPNNGLYSALIVDGVTQLVNSTIEGDVDTGSIDSRLTAVDVKPTGHLTVTDGVDIIGSTGVKTQDDTLARVFGIHNEGTLVVTGGLIQGASDLQPWTNSPDVAPAVAAVRHAGVHADLGGQAILRGGTGSRVHGLLATLGTLTMGPNVVAECGGSNVGSAPVTGAACIGAFISTPSAATIRGTFLGSEVAFAGTSVGLDWRVSPAATHRMEAGTIVKGTSTDDNRASVDVSQINGLRLLFHGQAPSEGVIAGLIAEATVTQVGSAILIDRNPQFPDDNAALTLRGDDNASPASLAIATVGTPTASSVTGLNLVSTGVYLDANVSAVISGIGNVSMGAARIAGRLEGSVQMSVDNGSVIGTANTFGIDCGASLPNLVTSLELGAGGNSSVTHRVTATNGDAIGIRGDAHCSVQLDRIDLAVQAADGEATGVIAEGNDLTTSDVVIAARGADAAVAAELDCLATSSHQLTASTLLAEATGFQTVASATGVRIDRQDACAQLTLNITGGSVTTGEADDTSIAIESAKTFPAGPAEGVPGLEIRVAGATIEAGNSPASSGLNLDLSDGALLLDKNIITVASNDALLDKSNTGVSVFFLAPPLDLQLWNNFIKQTGAGPGVGVNVFARAGVPAATPYQHQMIYNTVEVGAHPDSTALALEATAFDAGDFRLMELAGNAFVARGIGIPLTENCENGTAATTQAVAQTFNVLSTVSATFANVVTLSTTCSDAVLLALPRYANGVETGLYPVNEFGCLTVMPALTKNPIGANVVAGLDSLIFSTDFVHEDAFGHARPDSRTLAGRCSVVNGNDSDP